jgi:adenine-specific DNA-methyltransferase
MAEEVKFQKVDGKSLDIEAVDKEKLKKIFPQCFNEGKLDINKLLSLCGEYIDNDFEKYKFEWKGKSECYRIAGKRSTGTLRPCPKESVDFENTNNLYIEGDNLEVLKLLQTAYYCKVKMIYIDPPYNTGNDFVYEDDFKDPLAKYKEITSQTTKSNPETMGRYHTNWLNMMYPRLRLAANLLRDDGVIFISIDDNEVYNLQKLCNEVFGEENFVGLFTIQSNPRGSQNSKNLSYVHEYILMYAKSICELELRGLGKDEEAISEYSLKDETGRRYRLLGLRKRGGAWRKEDRPNMFYPVYVNPKNQTVSLTKLNNHFIEVIPKRPTGELSRWTWGLEKFKQELDKVVAKKVNRIGEPDAWDIFRKDYIDDDDGEVKTTKVKTIWCEKETNYQNAKNEIKELFGNSEIFDYPKPTYIINKLASMLSMDDFDIILDFFSGSATTAHAVMQLNAEDGMQRRFILIQLPELCNENSQGAKAGYKNICEIGKERIRRAGAKIKAEHPEVDTGFKVLKLDTSNLVKWDDTPTDSEEDLFNRMNSVVKSLKNDRSELDVVFEVMLKLGIPPTYKVNEISVNGRKVYSIGDDGLVLICLDSANGGITPEDISAMCDLAPAKIVAAEEAFEDDIALSNAYYISKDKGIEIELL